MISREQEKKRPDCVIDKTWEMNVTKKGDHQTALLLYKKVTAYESLFPAHL